MIYMDVVTTHVVLLYILNNSFWQQQQPTKSDGFKQYFLHSELRCVRTR